MKINIEADEGQVLSFKLDGECSLDEMIAIFFSILDNLTRQCLEKAPEDAKNYFYEHFNGVFDLFLRKVFPEPPKGYFELSDAALLYAQDKIIDEAEKKGMTFQEALDKYENRAKEYIRQQKEGLA